MTQPLQSPTVANPGALTPVHPAIEQYMLKLLANTDHPVLAEMEALAEKNNFPIVGRLSGVFLEVMAKSIMAKRVFEFGSGYGYSAYWFAKAVGEDGEVMASEADPLNCRLAEQYLGAAGLASRVKMHTGLAQEVFAASSGLFDICYNDVDKIDYPRIWALAKTRIRPGGLYIADNTLWRGRVASPTFTDLFPGWTEAIMAHNEMIFNDPDFDAFINPTRDGLLVARRKT